MLRQPISPNIRFSDYNNNNLHEYDPYIINDGALFIDSQWWESLTGYIRELISIRLHNKFELVTLKFPHEVPNETEGDSRLLVIYQSYLDGFDYNVWWSDFSDFSNFSNEQNLLGVKMIHIPDILKKQFLNISQNEGKNNNHISSFLKNVYASVDKNVKYFIRLSSTSGKNEKTITPFSFNKEEDGDALLKHLTSMNIFATREYRRDKDTYLILIPWNDSIDNRCEFRIFIVNNKLTAASPQRWWEVHNYSPKELKAIELALNNCSFIVNDIYQTFVADVWIDMKNKSCHLIEFNPFGAHCGAGSSLFNWETDFDILHGISPSSIVTFVPILRYLSIINY